MNIDVDKLDNVTCDCGNDTFLQVFKLKHISALISPNGQEGIINIPFLVCSSCGKDYQEIVKSKQESKLIKEI